MKYLKKFENKDTKPFIDLETLKELFLDISDDDINVSFDRYPNKEFTSYYMTFIIPFNKMYLDSLSENFKLIDNNQNKKVNEIEDELELFINLKNNLDEISKIYSFLNDLENRLEHFNINRLVIEREIDKKYIFFNINISQLETNYHMYI